MKIHLGNDAIQQTNEVQYKDIPLAFIDTYDSEYKVHFNIKKEFSFNTSTQIKAYDIINNPSAFFFDSNNKLLKNTEVKRLGGSYIYEPRNITEFSPVMFSASAVVKKNMKFSDTEKYNLKVTVADSTQELPLANQLIKIFGDGYHRNLCPSNITINEGTLIPQYLLKYQPTESDFMFVRCNDVSHMPNGLNFQDILNSYSNIWCFVKTHTQYIYEVNDDTEFTTQEGHLNSFYRPTKRNKKPTHFFKQLGLLPTDDSLINLGYTLEQVYEDVLIYNKPKSGFLIVAPDSFADNIVENSKIIYDVMMYVFLQAYYKTKSEYTWITNDPVDYIAQSNQKINMYHNTISLENLLKNDNYNIGNAYTLIDVKTSDPNILFVGMSNDGDLYFRKQTGYITDPIKPDNYISYLTTRHTVLLYTQQDINYKETKLNISYFNREEKVFIEIDPIFSSEQEIYIPYKQTLEIPDVTKTYYLCTKRGHVDKINLLEFVDAQEYSMDKHGIIICELYTEITKAPKAIDIRIFGGGLPDNAQDDFNMIDIGNIYGRPYRIGSTVIIKLPKALQQYEQLLLKELDKHIASGEIPVLIFE